MDNEPCKWILVTEIGTSRVRIWDVLILIPNVLFLVFLLFGVKNAWLKLRLSRMPIWLSVMFNILRCIVYMTVTARNPVEDTIDKVLWLILRFFLLTMELSVLIFALAFGRLESNKSVRLVLLFASLFSMGYLEIFKPDAHFNIKNSDYNLFGYGGLNFLCVTASLFFLLYIVIFTLPNTKLKEKITLPTKKSFYHYCMFLAILNLILASSSIMVLHNVKYSLCVINIVSYTYLVTYAPIVYRTFLKGVFKITYANLFAYKPQINDPTALVRDNYPPFNYPKYPTADQPGSSSTNKMIYATDAGKSMKGAAEVKNLDIKGEQQPIEANFSKESVIDIQLNERNLLAFK